MTAETKIGHMERQFTATAYIFQGDQTLLIRHPKLGKWLPPGGHLEPNETPPEAAIREAKEETGLDIEILKNEHLWINRWNAESFARPYLCLLENIPPHRDQPAHQHIDFIYLSRPTGGEISKREIEDLRWFTLEEILALEPDVEIFAETQETLSTIFENLSTLAQK